MAQRIRDVMTAQPIALAATASVQDAARAMRDDDIGDVIVLDDRGSMCGVVTDRDIVVRAAADDRRPSEVLLGDICSRDVIAIGPNDATEDAVRMMREHALRRLPVTENDKPVGIVSLGDLAIERDPESVLAGISAAPPNN